VGVFIYGGSFFMNGSSSIEKGKVVSYGEFFISQLTNGRFLSILIAFLIFIPIAMILEIKRIRTRDNMISFL
jgi:large-conductance mechanosensitive channel